MLFSSLVRHLSSSAASKSSQGLLSQTIQLLNYVKSSPESSQTADIVDHGISLYSQMAEGAEDPSLFRLLHYKSYVDARQGKGEHLHRLLDAALKHGQKAGMHAGEADALSLIMLSEVAAVTEPAIKKDYKPEAFATLLPPEFSDSALEYLTAVWSDSEPYEPLENAFLSAKQTQQEAVYLFLKNDHVKSYEAISTALEQFTQLTHFPLFEEAPGLEVSAKASDIQGTFLHASMDLAKGTPFQTWREEVMTMKENIAAIWGATSPQYASALTVISQGFISQFKETTSLEDFVVGESLMSQACTILSTPLHFSYDMDDPPFIPSSYTKPLLPLGRALFRFSEILKHDPRRENKVKRLKKHAQSIHKDAVGPFDEAELQSLHMIA